MRPGVEEAGGLTRGAPRGGGGVRLTWMRQGVEKGGGGREYEGAVNSLAEG